MASDSGTTPSASLRSNRRASKLKRTPPNQDHSSNTKSKSYVRPLFDAVYNNDVQKVKQLIKVNKFHVNVIDDDHPLKPTPLLVACEYQFMDIIRILMKAKPKPNVNQANARGRLPIWWAAKHGNNEMAEMLIYDGKEDCDVKTVDNDSGCTPLFRAILSNVPEVCRLLIHAGADVNLRRLWKVTGESEVAESPLVKSVQMGSLGVCEVLVNSLCNINAKTEDGFTALHYAVGYRRYAIAEFLLENRIRVNARSRKGITAMTVAIKEQLPAMCKMLVEWGYDIDKTFKWGETPLEMSIRLHAETCAMILVAWGCVIVPDRRLRYTRRKKVPPSVFEKAAKEGLIQLMRLMIDIYPYFLSENWVRDNSEGKIPLALYRQPEFVEWLFEESATPRSLGALCKGAILVYLGRYGCKRIDKLPIPTKLKDFLRLDHYFSDKVYRHVPLEDDDCPYHCPSLCPRNPQCPELDFSDSCSD